MTRQGSLHPLRCVVASAEPVMFAYVLDTPAHREALQEEILDRIAAIQAPSETAAGAKIEAHDAHSHGGILDVHGMIEAHFHPGP